jgi:C4-dicarboxylate transporter, DctQ subunit
MEKAPSLTEFSQLSEQRSQATPTGLTRTLHVWSSIESAVVGVLAAAALCVVIYTIVVRLVAPTLTPSWSDEVTVYLMIWGIFIACSSVTAENGHVRADLVTSQLSPRNQTVLECVSNIAGAIFTAILCWYGYEVARDAYEFGDLSTTTLRFPMWIYYACLPVGAALMSIRYLLLTYMTIIGLRASDRNL